VTDHLVCCHGVCEADQDANMQPGFKGCSSANRRKKQGQMKRRAARRAFVTVWVYPFKSWWVHESKCGWARVQKSFSQSNTSQKRNFIWCDI